MKTCFVNHSFQIKSTAFHLPCLTHFFPPFLPSPPFSDSLHPPMSFSSAPAALTLAAAGVEEDAAGRQLARLRKGDAVRVKKIDFVTTRMIRDSINAYIELHFKDRAPPFALASVEVPRDGSEDNTNCALIFFETDGEAHSMMSLFRHSSNNNESFIRIALEDKTIDRDLVLELHRVEPKNPPFPPLRSGKQRR